MLRGPTIIVITAGSVLTGMMRPRGGCMMGSLLMDPVVVVIIIVMIPAPVRVTSRGRQVAWGVMVDPVIIVESPISVMDDPWRRTGGTRSPDPAAARSLDPTPETEGDLTPGIVGAPAHARGRADPAAPVLVRLPSRMTMHVMRLPDVSILLVVYPRPITGQSLVSGFNPHLDPCPA